jgi:PhnB protein
MTTVNTYLIFDGNCEEAFTFYKSVFGGEFTYLGRYKDMPPTDGQYCPPEDLEKVMHVSLPISAETVIMGSDSSKTYGQATVFGNNISLSINADSKESADLLFTGLSSGGQVKMPMNQTFWGAYFGMFTDKFGIHWMVNYDAVEQK